MFIRDESWPLLDGRYVQGSVQRKRWSRSGRLRLLAAPLSCGGGSFGSGTSRLSAKHNNDNTPVAPAHPSTSVSHNGAHASKHAYHASPLLPTHDDSFEDACHQRADSALDHARGLHAALSIAGLFGPAHHRVITRLLRVDYAPVMTRLGSHLQRPQCDSSVLGREAVLEGSAFGDSPQKLSLALSLRLSEGLSSSAKPILALYLY